MKQYILRFSRPSCNPCAILKLTMGGQPLPPEIEVLDIDVTQSTVKIPGTLEAEGGADIHKLISGYNIRSVPTLVVIDDKRNEVQPRWTGQATPKEYEEWLLSWTQPLRSL